MSGAQEGGEFFTPPSLVRTIVNMIEPDRGNVLDPACGSAGMFVQTGHFVENRGEDASAKITFYGQEKSDTNTRLARMNLAVHGLEGIIRQGNTFYDRWEELLGQCDFVMSNPPFNVDGVSPEKVKTDSRLFTEKKIPGIAAKTKAVSNANYLWIQYFYSYLNERGRAGFVMASSASDAGHGEKEIREELIATQAVDMIISIGTNFFYTKSLPCTLWFFDKGKPAERQDKVLMIDARNVYRVVTRKIRDFSEEQLQNITAIAWLYRGQQERYLGLVGDYLNKTHQEAGTIAGALTELESPLIKLTQLLQTFSDSLGASLPLLKNLPEVEGLVAEDIANQNVETFRATLSELEAGIQEFTAVRVGLISELQVHLACFAENNLTPLPPFPTREGGKDHNSPPLSPRRYANAGEGLGERSINEAQKECAARFAPFIPQLKTLQKHINEVHKVGTRAVDLAEKKLEARKQDTWDGKEVKKQRDALDTVRDQAIFAIKSTLYMKAQVTWLQSRFPEAVFVDVPGLCKVVTRDEITQQDSSLTPGRYVGVTLLEESIHLLYKEWFVRSRFPGYESVKVVDSIPEGWRVLTLDEIVLEIIDYRGKTPKKLGSDWSNSGIIALSALNVKKGKLVNLEKCKLVNEDLYQKWMKSELKQGDILMTSEAPLGELYYLAENNKFCLSQRLYSIRANPEVIKPVILFCALNSSQIQGEIHARKSGTTVFGIRQSELRKVPIIVPSIEIQNHASEILNNLFMQKEKLQKTIYKLQQARDLLLPRLMNGSIAI